MSIAPANKLRGVLPVVISGNRPMLTQRCTHQLLAGLHGVTADPVWLVRDEFVDSYRDDGHEIVTYSRADAEAYAEHHWLGPEVYEPGQFLGCFTEREWSCRVAAERGCWAVLQLDDNLKSLSMFSGYGASFRMVREAGGLGLFADLLAAVTLSTNSRMTGAKLQAVNPREERHVFARAGFPYSLFLERVDLPDRPEYIGPIEEDILQAYHYGAATHSGTASIVHALAYTKEHVKSAHSGMRQEYRKQMRAAGLQMVAPEMVKAIVKQAHANGSGDPRIFHQMRPGSVRTPLVVHDRELFDAARDYCIEFRRRLVPALRQEARESVEHRARRGAARQALFDHMGT